MTAAPLPFPDPPPPRAPVLREQHGRARAALALVAGHRLERVLDWGCGEGGLALGLASIPELEVLACDVDAAYVDALREQGDGRIGVFHVDDLHPRVGLEARSVDVIACLDVLEHMGDASRTATLDEMHRLLRADGRLVVTVPHRGILHWADPENVKFRAPRLHRAIYRLARGGQAYERTYGADSRFGNYSHDGGWHHHFSEDELVRALSRWFTPDKSVHFGLIHPVVRYLMLAHEAIARGVGRRENDRLHRALWRLYFWDADLVTGRWSYNLGMSFVPRADVTGT